MKRSAIFVLMSICSALLCAADIFVDYEKGSNKNPGTKSAPLGSFHAAFSKAKPGDTIYILPASGPIRDSIIVRGKSGTGEHPIVIDGMNNIFLGTMPLDPQQWQEISPGYFCKKIRMATNISNRYFMVRNGKLHRMGRFNKSPGSQAYKKIEDLAPGEWTIIRSKKISGRIYDMKFVLRLPEGTKTPAEAGFEEPLRSRISGVNISGQCNNITFRNIIVKNFLNDGYNIHGNCRNILFENVAAVDCGDDGISAHETCQIFVKNFVAIGCSTCACHIQKAESHHENVYAENILGIDLLFTDNTVNTFKNVWIKGNSNDGFRLTTGEGTIQNFSMENCRMVNYNSQAAFSGLRKGTLNAVFKDVKIAGYRNVDQKYIGIQQVDADRIEAEIEAARKRMFAIFNGQLEKAIIR